MTNFPGDNPEPSELLVPVVLFPRKDTVDCVTEWERGERETLWYLLWWDSQHSQFTGAHWAERTVSISRSINGKKIIISLNITGISEVPFPLSFLIHFFKEEAWAGAPVYEESPEPCEGRDKERKGSTCKQLRPLPTFVKVESQSSVELAERTYVRKNAAELTVEEKDYNDKLYEETLATIFPEDKMSDKFYRDKVIQN